MSVIGRVLLLRLTALGQHGGKYTSVNCVCLRVSITDLLYRVITLCRLIVRVLNGVNGGAAEMIPDVRRSLPLAERVTSHKATRPERARRG